MEEQIAESGKVQVVSDKEVSVIPAKASDNFVLRKLLKGRRYFDPPNSYFRTCYKCGDDGHTAGNCTVKKLRKPCYKCGRRNHNVKRCTKRKDCLICKKGGHRAKDCPVKHPGPQDANSCLKCGEAGHDMFSCKTSYSADDLKDIRCYICRNLGHLCCVEYTDIGPAEVSCYSCGQLGHSGLECPAPASNPKQKRAKITNNQVASNGSELVTLKTRCVKEKWPEVICLSNDCKATRCVKEKKPEVIYLSNDCNASHTNKDFDDGGSKLALDKMKCPAPASNSKEKHVWTTNDLVASNGSELVTPKMRRVKERKQEVIYLSNGCNSSHTNKDFDERGSKSALDNMEWAAPASNSKQKRARTTNDQVASNGNEYKINGWTSLATIHNDPPSDLTGHEEEISDEPKKPVDITPLGSLSPEDVNKILESLSMDQLVPILRSALLLHPDVLDAVRTVADADPTQRKLFVRGLSWETTTKSLRNTFSTYGEIVEAVVITDKANGKSKGYGFVTFKHTDAVILALKEPNKKIDGRITVTQLAASGNSGNSHSGDVSVRKIYVGNVPFKISSERLLQYFSVYGEIEEGPLGFDKQTGNTKGFAFFVYRTEEGARASLSEPMKNLDGHKVVCRFATVNKKVKTAGQGDDRMGVWPMLGSNFGFPGGYNGFHSGQGSGPKQPGMVHQTMGVPGGPSFGGQGSGYAATGYGSSPSQYSGGHAA